MTARTLLLARVVRFGALGAALAITSLIAIAFLPTIFGREVLVVQSRSMEPWANVGDVVVTRTVDARTVGVGDVITFRAPDASTPTTHRVVEVLRREGDASTFVTQGDANEDPDPQPVRVVGNVAEAERVIPFAGRVVAAIRTPTTFLALLLVGLCVGALERACEAGAPRRSAGRVATT